MNPHNFSYTNWIKHVFDIYTLATENLQFKENLNYGCFQNIQGRTEEIKTRSLF